LIFHRARVAPDDGRATLGPFAPKAEVFMTSGADAARNTIGSLVVRTSCFVLMLGVSHLALVALAATASPTLKKTIAKYSNVPLGYRRDHNVMGFDELERVRGLDIFFVGSSHSHRTFDPRYFERQGMRAFNVGTPNQTPINTYYLLQRYLPEVRPRLVVLEVWWEVLGIDAVEGTIAITVSRGPGWDTLKMAATTRHLMALNSQWSSLIERTFGTATPVQLNRGDVYTSRGYCEQWGSNSASGVALTGQDMAVNEQQMKYLSRTLGLLRDHDVRTILVWAPVTTARRGMVTNLEVFRQRVTALSRAHNVPFVDLDGLVPLDDHLDFMDDHHLNQRGVDKLMPAFAQVLRANRLVDDVGDVSASTDTGSSAQTPNDL
jgi:hypothetical protein